MTGDLTFAGRMIRRNALSTAAMVVTMALGCGASTAVFSVMNAVLLRPLPYRNPERLVIAGRDMFSNAGFLDFQRAAGPVFEDIAGVSTFRAFVPREDGSTEQISRALVTTNFLRMLGARIVLGRDFTATDADPQPGPSEVLPPGSAAILSYEYWQRRYGGDAGVLGREMLTSAGRGPRIVGVLAPGFRLYFPAGENIAAKPDFWVADNIGYDNAHRNLMTLRAIGLLRKGLPPERAQKLVDALEAELAKNAPGWNFNRSIRLEPMHRYLVAEVRPAILALMGSVIFLLLIACANVANLLLVRTARRARELAVRAALGAGRRRLMRQFFIEACLLCALGTLLGIWFAYLGVRALPLIARENLPRIETVAIDWSVLAFAAAAGLASAVIFSALPAWRAARPGIAPFLHAGNAPGARPARFFPAAVVIGEVALSFVLLTGAGLMFRSLLALRRVDPGYDPRGVLTFMLARQWPLERQEGRQALLRQVQNQLRALPGVLNASASVSFPLAPGPRTAPPPRQQHPPAEPTAEGAEFEFVLPGYFETLRTPLLAGRTFTEADNLPGRRLAVIDELLAAKAFPGVSPLGRRIRVPWPDMPWVEVIGVVAHQRAATLADPGREAIYFADGFDGIGVSRHWAVRTEGDPAKYAPAVRAGIARIDKQFVVSQLQPMTALVEREQAGTRFDLLLLGAFAGIAVFLAAVGLYGVLSTLVQQRTAEIGVRMALGAVPGSIFRMVGVQGLRLTAAGLAAGFGAALWLTKGIASMLVGVKPTDPGTFAATALLFLLIAALACWVPARRACRIDPNLALRGE